MDFGFSEEQEMLRSSARDFLAKEAPMTYVRKMMDDERGYTDELWRKMAALGWMGLVLPEAHGGSGLDFVDMVVVLEEMGRAVLPGPFFSTVILAGIAIVEGGSADQKAKYLPKIADGSLKATLAHLEPSGRWDAEGIQLTGEGGRRGSGRSTARSSSSRTRTWPISSWSRRAPGTKGTDGVSLFLVDAKRRA
jgi:alkylation response protein AidB-like acyl-CoA dehydrogenase